MLIKSTKESMFKSAFKERYFVIASGTFLPPDNSLDRVSLEGPGCSSGSLGPALDATRIAHSHRCRHHHYHHYYH